MLAPRCWRHGLTKLVLILWLYTFIFVENWINTIRYMIFQFGLEPFLIQRIFIGFEAILELKYDPSSSRGYPGLSTTRQKVICSNLFNSYKWVVHLFPHLSSNHDRTAYYYNSQNFLFLYSHCAFTLLFLTTLLF